ncbi:MAG: metallophosphoesterase [Bdellovibrionales bacterium]|nr:metallophosphoesterase [Bdellovibrionales bacterium]
MENIYNIGEEVDFTKANFTAIVSDLHLCEAEPVDPDFPLWKKYKTREFFFDHQFRQFLEYIDKKASGEKIELVLNGDVFDFDSMMFIPLNPTFKVSWLERHRGLEPEEEKSQVKVRKILEDHQEWCEAMRWFIEKGHRAVFVIGNHDLELHFKKVQIEIMNGLNLSPQERKQVRFVEWFYISNKDTLIEHGNQYDPYCVCDDPVNPFVVDYNQVQVRLPFGDWACRYLANGMGFFNPHVETNFDMTVPQYIAVFFRYMARAQPLILWTWFWSCVAILWRTIYSNMQRPLSDPLTVEDRVESIAKRSNATTRMVREMKELFVVPAASTPRRIMKELWLDRAFLVLISLFVMFQIINIIKLIYDLSFFWVFIPIFILLPPFVLYARNIDSYVQYYKKPSERTLTTAGMITKTSRVIYGHTHEVRHELIGGVEHLNSGTWSPAFEDVECTKSEDAKTFIWIEPQKEDRRAQVFQMVGDQAQPFFRALEDA